MGFFFGGGFVNKSVYKCVVYYDSFKWSSPFLGLRFLPLLEMKVSVGDIVLLATF